jgi:hypothetical protein
VESKRVRADVVYDKLSFVYSFDVQEDFKNHLDSINIGTLLMSKLQIRQLGLRDVVHICAVLLQCNVEERVTSGEAFRQVATRAALDYRCERDFRRSLEITAKCVIGQEIRLNGEETLYLRAAIHSCTEALDRCSRGIMWWARRGLALLGVGPEEPEEENEEDPLS